MTHARHTLLWTLAFALLASPPYAQAPGWQIDPDHTSVQFAVSHMRTSTVRGRFNKTTGTVKWDGRDFASASVEIVAEVESIDTGVPKRDAHLRTADFLMIEKHPTMSFKSVKDPTGWRRQAEDGRQPDDSRRDEARGLRRRGGLGAGQGARWRHPRRRVRDRHNRQEGLGLRWNRVLEAGGLLVGFQVAITIDIEVVERAGGDGK